VSAPTSLILITVDCLRADHTGFMGYARPTTPFLDGLAAESFVFPKAIAVGAPTYYSFPGIMASRFPLALGREVVGLAAGEPTLATVLQEAGYCTAAYVAGNPYLSNRFGYARGFEVFQDFPAGLWATPGGANNSPETARRPGSRLNFHIARTAHRIPPLGKLYDELYFQYRHRLIAHKALSWDTLRRFPAADVLVDQACDWLGSIGREPFFLWLHFMDPHAPYYPTAEALAAMGDSIDPDRGRYLNGAWVELGGKRLQRYREEIVRLHDAGIRWVDMQVARLAGWLRQRSLWDSSVFALTADHGEEFLDHGGRFHYPSRIYQEMLHVPLLVRVPGGKKMPLSDAPFSHLHLAPTLLDAVGLGAPPEFAGQSYWSEMQRGGGWEWALSESIGECTNPMEVDKRMGGRVLVVQDRRHKLALDFDHNREELFDLSGDPRELQALPAGTETAARARLLETGLRHLSRTPGVNRDVAMRARLRELGLEWRHSTMNAKTLAS
jgi:arylsulfatase A-like enzyme